MSKAQRMIESKLDKKAFRKYRSYLQTVFFSPTVPMIYVARMTKNNRSTGYRYDVTPKAIYCVAAYLCEMERRTKAPYGVKTPFGILTLVADTTKVDD